MKNISIIPKPAEIKVRPDYLDLRDIMGIMIAENSKELKNTADIFKSFFHYFKFFYILIYIFCFNCRPYVIKRIT